MVREEKMVAELWWCGADAVMEARQFASRRCAELRRFALAVCDGVAVVAVAAVEMVKLRWRCAGGGCHGDGRRWRLGFGRLKVMTWQHVIG